MAMDLGVLPAELRAQAVPLGGEFAWPPAAARAVIEFLGEHGIAVIGVEVWLAEDGYPRVWGWSGYDVVFVGDWNAYVEEAAVQALAEVSKEVPEDALFNLTWIDRARLDHIETVQADLQTKWPREPPPPC
jgi:hypothetical protein